MYTRCCLFVKGHLAPGLASVARAVTGDWYLTQHWDAGHVAPAVPVVKAMVAQLAFQFIHLWRWHHGVLGDMGGVGGWAGVAVGRVLVITHEPSPSFFEARGAGVSVGGGRAIAADSGVEGVVSRAGVLADPVLVPAPGGLVYFLVHCGSAIRASSRRWNSSSAAGRSGEKLPIARTWWCQTEAAPHFSQGLHSPAKIAVPKDISCEAPHRPQSAPGVAWRSTRTRICPSQCTHRRTHGGHWQPSLMSPRYVSGAPRPSAGWPYSELLRLADNKVERRESCNRYSAPCK